MSDVDVTLTGDPILVTIDDEIIEVVVALRGPIGPPGPDTEDALALLGEPEGAGIVGYDPAETYPDGTVGAALVDVPYAASAMYELKDRPRPSLRPNATFIAALLSGTTNGGILGDSISDASGTSYANSAVALLQSELRRRYRYHTWNFINRSIGGRSTAQLADTTYVAGGGGGQFTVPAPTGLTRTTNINYWTTGSVNGKTWLNHAKDDALDWVFRLTGENDGTDSFPYSTNSQTIVDLVGGTRPDLPTFNWTKLPWMVLKAGVITAGVSVNDRRGRQSLADYDRHYAIRNGLGLLDWNAYEQMLVAGRRVELRPWDDTSVWQAAWGNPSLSGTTGTFNKSGTSLTGNGAVRFFTPTRDLRFSANITATVSGSVYLITARERPSEGGWSIQGDLDSGYIRLYSRGVLTALTDPPVPVTPVNTAAWVYVEFDAAYIRVYHNGTKVADWFYPAGMEEGTYQIGWAAGQGTSANTEIVAAPDTPASLPFFSDAQIYSDTLHHPNGLGARKIIHASVMDFLDDFHNDVMTRTYPITARSTANIVAADAAADVPGASVTFMAGVLQDIPVSIEFGYLNSAGASGLVI